MSSEHFKEEMEKSKLIIFNIDKIIQLLWFTLKQGIEGQRTRSKRPTHRCFKPIQILEIIWKNDMYLCYNILNNTKNAESLNGPRWNIAF